MAINGQDVLPTGALCVLGGDKDTLRMGAGGASGFLYSSASTATAAAAAAAATRWATWHGWLAQHEHRPILEDAGRVFNVQQYSILRTAPTPCIPS